jgi:thioredoxin-dependent peroxiredoxin
LQSRHKLKVGDKAPDFELPSQEGKVISLRDFKGSKNIVLYFYPKDFTRGCTIETKTFGSNYEKIRELGGEVLGVSTDNVETHKQFASECKANFPLLSDEGEKVRKLYSVKMSFGLIPGRTTFVIDRRGIIRSIFSSQLNVNRHVDEALKMLRTLTDKESVQTTS